MGSKRGEPGPRVVGPGFNQRVYEVVRRVPEGCVTTYGDVAGALGAREVARHVGWALAALPPRTDVPWHRVVNARGEVSLRPGPGGEVQALKLRGEGLTVDARGRIADFGAARFDFAS